jgi:glycine cleavage system aminomethyltransferase T
MEALFGESINDLKYYWLRELDLDGIPLVVSRTGWSSELGYELYLRDGSKGDKLWEKIMAAGKPHGLKPGHTSSIRRIEGGMLSYHADADINTNPYEQDGIKRKQVGVILDCDPLTGPNTTFWEIKKDNKVVGKTTSAVYSPRLKQNIALAMVSINNSEIGTVLDVKMNDKIVKATVVEKPFYDPKKKLASS